MLLFMKRLKWFPLFFVLSINLSIHASEEENVYSYTPWEHRFERIQNLSGKELKRKIGHFIREFGRSSYSSVSIPEIYGSRFDAHFFKKHSRPKLSSEAEKEVVYLNQFKDELLYDEFINVKLPKIREESPKIRRYKEGVTDKDIADYLHYSKWTKKAKDFSKKGRWLSLSGAVHRLNNRFIFASLKELQPHSKAQNISLSVIKVTKTATLNSLRIGRWIFAAPTSGFSLIAAPIIAGCVSATCELVKDIIIHEKPAKILPNVTGRAVIAGMKMIPVFGDIYFVIDTTITQSFNAVSISSSAVDKIKSKKSSHYVVSANATKLGNLYLLNFISERKMYALYLLSQMEKTDLVDQKLKSKIMDSIVELNKIAHTTLRRYSKNTLKYYFDIDTRERLRSVLDREKELNILPYINQYAEYIETGLVLDDQFEKEISEGIRHQIPQKSLPQLPDII